MQRSEVPLGEFLVVEAAARHLSPPPRCLAAGKQSSPFASFALERAWPKYYWAVQDDKKYTEGYVEEARWGHHKGEKSMP
jgi:hypothetical protein